MRLYIDCFRADGTQILGNLDGQAALGEPKNYRRTHAYKRLRQIVGNPRWMNAKVSEARVVTATGQVLEVIK